MSSQKQVPAVLMFIGDVIDIDEAMRRSGKSDRTIRNWCRDDGIGRKYSKAARWEISAPALEMRLHGDVEALEMLRRGERDAEVVKQYIDHARNHAIADD